MEAGTIEEFSKDKRYLCWNDTGTVVFNDDPENVIGDFFDADIAEVVPLGDYPLILPKTSVANVVLAETKLEKIESKCGLDYQVSLIPTIETPLGVELVNEILRSSKSAFQVIRLPYRLIMAPIISCK